MTALRETAPTAIAYESLNSTLAETGWRVEWVTDEKGEEQLIYFPLTEAEFFHPKEGYSGIQMSEVHPKGTNKRDKGLKPLVPVPHATAYRYITCQVILFTKMKWWDIA